MRITRVTDEDRKLTRVSQAVAEAIESGQSVTLRKVGSRRPSEPLSVDDSLKGLIEERDSLRTRVHEGNLDGNFDLAAAAARLAELDRLIGVRSMFQRPNFTDRGGRL